MSEIALTTLVDALQGVELGTKPGSRLRIGTVPSPFVQPTLLTTGGDGGLGEVVFIEAAAAVGKSTIARYLSGMKNIPLLDLAEIPVSTGSLKALILDIKIDDPISEFHAGRLPIIVDALDEGRLASGEAGFESFLITTAEFLSEDRTVTDKPKLILLGRYESTGLGKAGIQISSDEISVSQLQVGFFREEEAWQLIEAYANAEHDSAVRTHPEPAKQVISAYFKAIESALGLKAGNLWKADHGRAFAGYAPVLAAVGSLLAKMDNFADVTSSLRATGAQQAWEVIETVLREILFREQKKVADKLMGQISTTVPSEAYDPSEQLTLLSQYVHKSPLVGSGRVKLTGPDGGKYREMVEMYIDEHPFVRSGAFGNDVLGSVVIAHSIIENSLQEWNIETAANLSLQPFLWRSFEQRLQPDSLIDANYVGYILNSYWNEPLRALGKKIKAASVSEDEAIVSIEDLDFRIMGSLTFYGQVRDCEIDITNNVHLIGYGGGSSASVLFMRGDVTIICAELDVETDAIRFEGKVWLEAGAVSASPRLRLHLNGSQVGWGGAIPNTHPWRGQIATLAPPYEVASDDQLREMVEECTLRLSTGATLTLHPDFKPSDDDPQMGWVRRRFSSQFPTLISLLIEHNFANPDYASRLAGVA